jgi:hypothetical protein
MNSPDRRIAFIVNGVVQQAMRDSGRTALRLVGENTPESELIERWCGVRFSKDAASLTVTAASKTLLLLAGPDQPVDLAPLGDLYFSEIARFCRGCRLTGSAAEFANAAGGAEVLDECLRKLLDERRDPDAAFAAAPQLREPVLKRLQQTRFRRARAGIIPKIGPRTIGIDLFI